MPKVRCSGCETVLNAPDKARGKVIACPKCGTKLKVPGGDAAAPAPRPKATVKAAQKDSEMDLGKLDLDRLQQEAEGGGVCPYCAAELDPEDPVCRSCGMNVEKGQMDAREQRRRTLKGLDPQLFYTSAWKESLAFVKENVALAVRTGWIWALFATMNATCVYMSLVFCKNWPTKAFWGGLAVISALGIAGWFLSLVMGIITVSIVREPFRADRFYFDFFKAASAGGRVIFWPLVVIGPFLPLLLIFYLWMLINNPTLATNPKFFLGLVIAAEALPVLVLPIALVHMVTKHPYKAWILWELLVLFFKNAGASLYFLLISLLAFTPAILVAGLVVYLIGAANPFVSPLIVGQALEGAAPAAMAGAAEGPVAWSPGLTGHVALWIMGIADLGTDQSSFMYSAMKGAFNILAASIVMTPIAFIAAFPAVFVMRMAGLFGLYRTHTLDLVQRIMPGTPATFWVRYLAHSVDLAFMPLAGFLVTANPKTLTIQWVVTGFLLLIWVSSPAMLPVGLLIFSVYTNWNYWAIQESSQLKSTFGKDAFGLIVVTQNDKVVSVKTATLKWFLRNLWYFSGGIPFMMLAFNSEKLALHDQITRTKVVFKGDK